MMRIKQLLGLAAAVALSTPTFAISYSGSALQGVLDGITQTTASNPTGNSSIDVTNDYLNDGIDTYWAIGGSGGAVNTLIVELASFKDDTIFGIYDAITNQYVEIFDGAASAGDSNKTISMLLDGSIEIGGVDTGTDFSGNMFNFYLDSSASNGGGLFYSDTNLNTDGIDHMLAFQGVGDQVQIGKYAAGEWGSNEYILAWEDLYDGGDKDYTDFVVMVESVNPVPVSAPATLALMSLGLLGLAGASKRRKV